MYPFQNMDVNSGHPLETTIEKDTLDPSRQDDRVCRPLVKQKLNVGRVTTRAILLNLCTTVRTTVLPTDHGRPVRVSENIELAAERNQLVLVESQWYIVWGLGVVANWKSFL